jgi:hypothetical protein
MMISNPPTTFAAINPFDFQLSSLSKIAALIFSVYFCNYLYISHDHSDHFRISFKPPQLPPSLPLQLHWSSRKRRRQIQTYVLDKPRNYFVGKMTEHGVAVPSNMTRNQLQCLRKSLFLSDDQDDPSKIEDTKKDNIDCQHPEFWDPHIFLSYSEIGRPLATEKPRFVLAWTTALDTFTSRQEAVLESIYYHHPTAEIEVYSTIARERTISTLHSTRLLPKNHCLLQRVYSPKVT